MRDGDRIIYNMSPMGYMVGVATGLLGVGHLYTGILKEYSINDIAVGGLTLLSGVTMGIATHSYRKHQRNSGLQELVE